MLRRSFLKSLLLTSLGASAHASPLLPKEIKEQKLSGIHAEKVILGVNERGEYEVFCTFMQTLNETYGGYDFKPMGFGEGKYDSLWTQKVKKPPRGAVTLAALQHEVDAGLKEAHTAYLALLPGEIRDDGPKLSLPRKDNLKAAREVFSLLDTMRVINWDAVFLKKSSHRTRQDEEPYRNAARIRNQFPALLRKAALLDWIDEKLDEEQEMYLGPDFTGPAGIA